MCQIKANITWTVDRLAEIKRNCITEFKQYIERTAFGLLTREVTESKITTITCPYFSEDDKENQFYNYLQSELWGMYNRHVYRETGL